MQQQSSNQLPTNHLFALPTLSPHSLNNQPDQEGILETWFVGAGQCFRKKESVEFVDRYYFSFVY